MMAEDQTPENQSAEASGPPDSESVPLRGKKPRRIRKRKIFGYGLLVMLLLCVVGAGFLYSAYVNYSQSLPDYSQLANYKPPMVTRVHGGDGRLLAEFAVEKRVFVPMKAIPKRVIEAFISAEDKKFYTHPGVDFVGVMRAVVTNLAQLGSNRRPVGASTITQQVAKNFLLTNEVSYKRKIKEAILAFRIEQAFSKEQILELYMNEIYLGLGSYGVAAASLNYFNKSLDELTIAEAAFLAGLPKAPANYNPYTRMDAAETRRNYVIGRMLEDGRITAEQAGEARKALIEPRERAATQIARADFFVEEARRRLYERFGEDQLYRGGLSVRTTLNPRLQEAADRMLRAGLIDYDRRHGWRGPFGKIDLKKAWAEELAKLKVPPEFHTWRAAVVLSVGKDGAKVGLLREAKPAQPSAKDKDKDAAANAAPKDKDKDKNAKSASATAGSATPEMKEDDVATEFGFIPLEEMKWARKWKKDQKVGGPVRHPRHVVKKGDVVLVEVLPEPEPEKQKSEKKTKDAAKTKETSKRTLFGLRQVPNIDGAIVALDPHTGRVLAMSGGLMYSASQFNRATQAQRQPGSAFKPFVYLAALDNGFTPASIILDAPIVIDQGPDYGKWKPSNYTKTFYGPSPMRLGIEKSRNLMTIRLAQEVGIETIAHYVESFGIVDNLPRVLSMSLGAGETTLLRMTAGYAMLVNGGKHITPAFIDRVQDREGKTVYRHDTRPCENCVGVEWSKNLAPPQIPDSRKEVADPRSAYQVVSMLQGVIERGTGRKVRAVGKPLAGKTGTTNDAFDGWFIGFSPDLAVGVFVGFDKPRTLGKGETGSSVAAPVFRDFMAEALKDTPAMPFRIPAGIRLVRINAATGERAKPGDADVILEAFKPGTEPEEGARNSSMGGREELRVRTAPTTRNVRGLY